MNTLDKEKKPHKTFSRVKANLRGSKKNKYGFGNAFI